MRALRPFLAACALWLLASAAHAAVTFTDLGKADGWSVSGTTVTIAPSANINSGDLILVSIYENSPSGGAPFPTVSDPAGDVFSYVHCQSVSNGAFDGQLNVAWAISGGVTTAQNLTITFGNSGEFAKWGLRKLSGATVYGLDKSICGQTAVSTTTLASGSLTGTVASEPVYGFAIAKGTGGAITQASGWSAGGTWGATQPNDVIDGFLASSTTQNYNPTTTTAPNGGASVQLMFNLTPPPFNPRGGGLLGAAPAINATQNDSCTQAPAPAAAAGYCLQTWSARPGEFNTQDVDNALSYGSGFKFYFDDCHGQSGATGQGNTTLGTGGANIVYGDSSGGFQANLASATCVPGSTAAPGQIVGTVFGGGGYFEATISFTAASVAGDWQAIWLWDYECSTNPVQDSCNWKNQQTKQPITSATYASATGVLSVTAPATTLTQFGSTQLSDLTGTGAFASLENTACYNPNAVTAATSYTINCKPGLGTLTLTGGNAGNAYFHFSEFDITEMFMGNFSNPLTQWQKTLHEWQKPASALNQYQTEVYTPGQVSFSSAHRYGLLWTPATSTPNSGSACSYYDGALQQCQTWSQFINNGTQAAPARYGISSGSYVSGTGVITLTLATSASFGVGTANIHLDNSSGAGGMPSQLVGNWTSIAGTTGTTLVLQGPVGQGSLSITGGEAAQPWANGVADLMHFIFYNGCTNANKCTGVLFTAWQKDGSQNLHF